MYIYLPIAEIPVNILLILSLGLVTGVLAGMFGVGGGFLSTPLLIFIGVPSAVAVSTSANQIAASSVSGVFAHLRRGNVDIKMGLILLLGGFFGSTAGVYIFSFLKKIGQIDLAITMVYVIFLGSIGLVMLIDSIKSLLKEKSNLKSSKDNISKKKKLFNKLPFKVYFPKSDIKLSLILPIIIGFLAGLLVSIMGIGGGFIMIPAMIYILRMPTNIVIGTSLFQIIFTSINVTILHSVNNHTVDIILGFLMIVSSVIGAQIGTRIGMKISPNKLRSILSLLILIVCLRMALSLLIEPNVLYNVEML